MNQFVGVGRLVSDPELRYTTSEKAVGSFKIAIDRRFKREGQPTADFIPCVAWGKTAEVVATYCKKGSRIAVCGSIQTRTWDKDDGSKQYITECVIDNVTLLESKKKEQDSPQQATIDDTSDVGF